MQAVIFVGIQASGKSTFWQEHFRDTHLRINLDMLRTRHREKIILDACIEAGQPFLVDNTNPTVEDRARYIAPARSAGFDIVGYYFQSRVHDCLARNVSRDQRQRIPEAGLLGCAARLVLPTLAEGFANLWYVSLVEGSGFNVEEWRDEVH